MAKKEVKSEKNDSKKPVGGKNDKNNNGSVKKSGKADGKSG